MQTSEGSAYLKHTGWRLSAVRKSLPRSRDTQHARDAQATQRSDTLVPNAMQWQDGGLAQMNLSINVVRPARTARTDSAASGYHGWSGTQQRLHCPPPPRQSGRSRHLAPQSETCSKAASKKHDRSKLAMRGQSKRLKVGGCCHGGLWREQKRPAAACSVPRIVIRLSYE
jgi:hypothetical protein